MFFNHVNQGYNVDSKIVSEIIEKVFPIIEKIKSYGGVSYLVGGTVRDIILRRETKDLDIEVHNLSLNELESCLEVFGKVSLIGKKFGVLKVSSIDVDWSLPRKDSKGRKPSVEIDPSMTIEDACRRRDITMNSMAINLNELCSFPQKEMTIIDPFGGQKDIKKKTLRVVDKDLFLDDPLRFFRVMQFIGRFEMEPDDELNDICKTMSLKDVATGIDIARERIFEEVKKLLLLSRRPSLGFRWLNKIERLRDIFPEIGSLVGIQQRADYHPEGTVFEHSMQSIDAAAVFDNYSSSEEKLMVILGVLCHDFGKPLVIDEELHAKGHDVAGVEPTKSFIKRLTNSKELCNGVCKLVRYHMMPGALIKFDSKDKAYKRLAAKLAPEVTVVQLAMVSLADVRGRNSKGSEPLSIGKDLMDVFLERVRSANVEKGPEAPVLLGRHLMGIVEPGPEMGRLLEEAYQIQIEDGIRDEEELKRRVLSS